jgi:hypothetical protein
VTFNVIRDGQPMLVLGFIPPRVDKGNGFVVLGGSAGRGRMCGVVGGLLAGGFFGALPDGPKDLVIEDNHQNAWNIEGTERAVDNKVGIVKVAKVGRTLAVSGLVQAQDNWHADAAADQPDNADGVDHSTMIFVACVLDGLGHCDKSSGMKGKKGRSCAALLI